jgi:hypothetical protein
MCIGIYLNDIVTCRPIARQRVAEHILEEVTARKNRTFLARQRRCKHTLSTIQGAFSMDPLRDYISSPIVNQKSVVEREREWSESSAVDLL